ncbi:hypothetical protein [Phaeacidiphilus oryzae]|uniref:hypothetical protein n=1 Tax=Phaeacidiphilus oryzae TaxID=348818 RepID=UPI00056D1AB9|nr:hypothetical protein [Phaeacidiphilus oryzae]
MTAVGGLALLLLFGAQLVTVVLGVTQVLTAHVVIGLLLTPVVALKMGSTGWRAVKYYRGDRAYRERGAPRMYYRILGPVLTALTALLLISGLLAFLGPPAVAGAALLTHKASFYLWLAALLLHVVPHYLEAVRLAAADLLARRGSRVLGTSARRYALLSVLAAGAVLALLLSGHAAEYVRS